MASLSVAFTLSLPSTLTFTSCPFHFILERGIKVKIVLHHSCTFILTLERQGKIEINVTFTFSSTFTFTFTLERHEQIEKNVTFNFTSALTFIYCPFFLTLDLQGWDFKENFLLISLSLFLLTWQIPDTHTHPWHHYPEYPSAKPHTSVIKANFDFPILDTASWGRALKTTKINKVEFCGKCCLKNPFRTLINLSEFYWLLMMFKLNLFTLKILQYNMDFDQKRDCFNLRSLSKFISLLISVELPTIHSCLERIERISSWQ